MADAGDGRGSILQTPEGGVAIHAINKTGAASKKGTVVDTDPTVDYAVKVVLADSSDSMGAIYEDGIADGELVWVVFSGIADILLEDGSACISGNWARTSITQAGRADITELAPPGAGILNADRHFKEIGHCLQTVTAGTDKLARCIIHFN